jgi:hypothetical protein
MSERPDSEQPRDEDRDPGAPPPPYPGWSTQQPPRPGESDRPGTGWTAPGQQPRGWTAPGEESGWTAPGQQPGSSGWSTPSAPPGAAPPPGAPPPGGPPPGGPPPGGWGTSPSWTWQQPTVKPGVIPLRPLGVGEILDGAVTTIRRNPGPMLGLSAIVALIVQLIGLAATWVIFSNIDALEAIPETPTLDEVIGATAGIFGSTGIIVVVDWIATVILTGILTVVVSRAVLGEHVTVAQAWARTRPRLLKLLLLTFLYGLIWISPLVVSTLLIVVLVAAGAGAGAAVIGLLLVLAALPTAAWLYVRYSLAAPALMLESTPAPAHHVGSAPRPIGIGLSFRRSSELVAQSWWRVFGILLLVWLVAWIIAQVIAVLFSVPYFLVGDPFDPASNTTFGMLALSALGGIVSTTITAPFLAAAIVLLYVDRRIRREALDIDLARAAGVSIPGRTDEPPRQ